MKKKPSIRKLNEVEIADIDSYYPIALKEADRLFPGNSEAEKNQHSAYYHRLMDDEMIKRGLRVRIC